MTLLAAIECDDLGLEQNRSRSPTENEISGCTVLAKYSSSTSNREYGPLMVRHVHVARFWFYLTRVYGPTWHSLI